MTQDLGPAAPPAPGRGPGGIPLLRWLPLLAILTVAVLFFALGGHKVLSLDTIGPRYAMLKAAIDLRLAASLAVYVITFITIVALSLPGSLVLTVTGGLLFGPVIGAATASVAAAIGAVILFLIAKTSVGDALAARAGPRLAKIRDGFNENAFHYLLFLRLMPGFPSFIANLAPALLGMRLRTFVLATLIGMLPTKFAYAFAGAALGSVIEGHNRTRDECLAKAGADAEAHCSYSIDTSALMNTELLIALALLGFIALLPVVFKAWSKPHAAGETRDARQQG